MEHSNGKSDRAFIRHTLQAKTSKSKSKWHSHVQSFRSGLNQQSLTEQQKRTLRLFSSVNYTPDHSLSYLTWIGQHKSRLYSRLEWDRWFLVFLIGVCIGLVAALLRQSIQALGDLQWRITKGYLKNGEIAKGFGYQAGTNCIYVAFGAILVTFVCPLAAGGGTVEVIAFLNGIMVHRMLTLKNLIVKFIANVLAVASGLPAAIQAPIITYGAIIGAGVGQFQAKTLGFRPNVFKRFRNSEDRRAFTTDGVAAGVAAGFNAPIGGMLFAMEDLSSFWSKGLSWQTFFCAVIATAVAQVFNTAFIAFKYQGNFGSFNLEMVEPLQMHVVTLVPAIVLGATGGLLGAFFTRLNVYINGLRKRLFTKPNKLWLQKSIRAIEPVFIVFIMTCFTVFMPLGFNCRLKGVLNNYTSVSDCYFQSVGTSKEIKLDSYNCLSPDANETQLYYNDVATLMQGSGTGYLNKLWSRGSFFMFEWSSCLAVFIVYFFMTIWTAGSAISGGIFVPILVSGGLLGRALGVGMIYIWQDVAGTSYPTNEWQWMDPGVTAALGSAALLGGVNRLEVASTVIVMEMVGDINLVIPILISIFVSKMTADQLSKPLYKFQLEGKALPYLDQDPRIVVKKRLLNMELFKICDVMSTPVLTIHIEENVSRLAKMLLSNRHSGFPVVKYDKETKADVAYGLVTRIELYAILCCDDVYNQETPGTVVTPNIPYEELSADYLTNMSVAEERLRTYARVPESSSLYINLDPFINISTPKVDKDFSLLRSYRIFRTLGLRHLVVIDMRNRVVGMITRQDLMQFHIQERVEKMLEKNGRDSISYGVLQPHTVITHHQPIIEEDENEFDDQIILPAITIIDNNDKDKSSDNEDDDSVDQCNNIKDNSGIQTSL